MPKESKAGTMGDCLPRRGLVGNAARRGSWREVNLAVGGTEGDRSPPHHCRPSGHHGDPTKPGGLVFGVGAGPAGRSTWNPEPFFGHRRSRGTSSVPVQAESSPTRFGAHGLHRVRSPGNRKTFDCHFTGWQEDRLRVPARGWIHPSLHQAAGRFPVLVPAEGGALERVNVGFDPDEVVSPNSLNFRSPPTSLPGEGVVLYSNDRETFALSLSSGRARLVLRGAESPTFLYPNTLPFTRGSDLMAVQFSTEELRIIGDPVLVEEGVTEALARYSPDGEWIAFASDELGRYEVYLARADGSGRRFQVSHDGGEEPIWAPDGRGLFFRNGEDMLSVDLTFGPDGAVAVSTPRLVFSLAGWVNIPGHSYDLSPDGSRFLVVLQEEGVSTRELRVPRDVRFLFPPGL
jgi:hypothetical protein